LGNQSSEKHLKKSGNKKLIVAAISLDICAQQLTLDLLQAGYEVYVVVDCSGTDEKVVETAAMMRLTQAGAVMVSWGSIAAEQDWRSHMLIEWVNSIRNIVPGAALKIHRKLWLSKANSPKA
jgi:hypothetical protein